MSKKDLLFVYNPKAGKARIRNHLLDVIDIFVKAGYEVTVRPTQRPGEAIDIVRKKKAKYDLVACCGGDGTLDEVVEGMMNCNKKVPIGYIPAGSTNDFAASLDIPKNMSLAAHTITDGKSFPCDIGMMNGQAFVYIAAFGVFTEVSYQTNQDMKNVLGHMAYLLEGMKKLTNIRSYHMKVFYDGMEVEDDFIYGMITNSISVGGFKNITGKNVNLDDGLFEVTLIRKPKTALELNLILAALVDRNIDAGCMYCLKTSKLIIEANEPVAWTKDGEFGGDHSLLIIENKQKALEIRVP